MIGPNCHNIALHSWQRINPTPCSPPLTYPQSPDPNLVIDNFEHYLSAIPPFFNEDFFSFPSSSEYYLSSAFSYFPYYYLFLTPYDDDRETEDDRKSKKKRRKRPKVAVLFIDHPFVFHLANT